MAKVLNQANDRIRRLTQYGVRTELTVCPGYVLTWSNGSAKWYRAREVTRGGKELRLDANEVFVPATAKELDAVIADLDPLPLYANSFEARFGRGR